MQLKALFQHPKALPAIPRVMQELLASFSDEKVMVGYLVECISSDQVLSAQLLRLANSAYYQVPHTVATVADAVALLGFTNVRTLVISLGLTGSFKVMPGFHAAQFWRHSLHTAVASRHLSAPLGLNTELAFTVGLMHAIGELVMHLAMPDEMLALGQSVKLLDPQRLDAQQATFGYSHPEVGAELARQWQFPLVFSNAIASAGRPLAPSTFDPLAALVHIAAWRSRAQENQLSAEAMTASWPADVAAAIALPGAAVLQDLAPLDQLTDGLAHLLA